MTASALIVAAGVATGVGTTNGDPVLFHQVNCTAHLTGGGTLAQKQDIGAQAIVPNQVNQGQSYTITLPSGSATLPSPKAIFPRATGSGWAASRRRLRAALR